MTRNPFHFCLAVACCLAATPAPAEEPPSMPEAPAFSQLTVKIEPFGLSSVSQTEELRIESTAIGWYRVVAREPGLNVSARPGAVFEHELSAARIRRLNRLLEATKWLTAPGAEGRATHTHPTTITIELKRDDGERKVVCHGQRPAPYADLLNELQGLALQERRVYLHDYVSGEDGARVWAEIGQEVAALRGEPYQQSPFPIEYGRYLPIALRIERRFYGQSDEAMVPALRLIGYLRAESERKYLHRLAHDRSSKVRREVAWALGRFHDDVSLPVLVSMMSQGGEEEIGFELIRWGEAAVPHIVDLIAQSTDDRLQPWENTIGESMIRAYLDNWSELPQPIDARVVKAVRESLKTKDPANGLIRTTYHREFLEQVEKPQGKPGNPQP